MSLLLGTDPSRKKLTELLEKSPSGSYCRRFFSDAAEAWLRTKQIVKSKFVIRGQVQDFRSGVTSIDAIKNLLTEGHQVKLRLDLHAKLFWFGDEMLVGSSNLTGSGFNLVERGGNIELNSVVLATSDNVAVAQKYFAIGDRTVTLDILSKMENFLSTRSLKTLN